jgi:hypothetical protein
MGAQTQSIADRAMAETHRVGNVPPPLEDYSAPLDDAALREAVRAEHGERGVLPRAWMEPAAICTAACRKVSTARGSSTGHSRASRPQFDADGHRPRDNLQ